MTTPTHNHPEDKPKTESKTTPKPKTPAAKTAPIPKRLYRSRNERMLGGVAGGMAEYFSMDPSLMRLIFVLLVLLPGIGLITYLILWFVIPEAPTGAHASSTPEPSLDDRINTASKAIEDRIEGRTPITSAQKALAIVLIGIGGLFLIRPMMGFAWFPDLWPIVLVAIGLFMLFNQRNRS